MTIQSQIQRNKWQIEKLELSKVLDMPRYESDGGQVTLSDAEIENQQFPDTSNLNLYDIGVLQCNVKNRLDQVRALQDLPDGDRQQVLQGLGKTQDELNKLEEGLDRLNQNLMAESFIKQNISPMGIFTNQQK